MASAAPGTFASFGSGGQCTCLWGGSPHLWLLPSMALTKSESCSLCMCGSFPCSSDPLTLRKAHALPWTCSAVLYSFPQISIIAVNPSFVPGVQCLKPESQHSAPNHCSGHANSISTGKCWSAVISVVNLFHRLILGYLIFFS